LNSLHGFQGITSGGVFGSRDVADTYSLMAAMGAMAGQR
jgi:hypothetical protein